MKVPNTIIDILKRLIPTLTVEERQAVAAWAKESNSPRVQALFPLCGLTDRTEG